MSKYSSCTNTLDMFGTNLCKRRILWFRSNDSKQQDVAKQTIQNQSTVFTIYTTHNTIFDFLHVTKKPGFVVAKAKMATATRQVQTTTRITYNVKQFSSQLPRISCIIVTMEKPCNSGNIVIGSSRCLT